MKRKMLIGFGLGLTVTGTIGLTAMAFYLNDKWYTSECKLIGVKHLAQTYRLMEPQVYEIKNIYGTIDPEELSDAGAKKWMVEYCRSYKQIGMTLDKS